MEQPAASRHPIVGSWSVILGTMGEQGHEQIPYLFTITADSCLTVSGPPVFLPGSEDPHTANGSPFVSAGHGTWESLDESNVILTFVRLVVDRTGAVLGRRVTRALVGFENGGATLVGQFSTEVLAAAGEVLGSGSGSFGAERILAEGLSEVEGTIRGVKP